MSSEEEGVEVGGGMVVELRRERGRVERLRLELKQVVEKSRLVEEQMKLELDANKVEIDSLQKMRQEELEQILNESKEKLNIKEAELKNVQNEANQLMKDNKTFETLYDHMKDEFQLLVLEMEKWQKLAEDRSRSEDLTKLMAKMKAREEEMSNNLACLAQKLELKERELVMAQEDFEEKEIAEKQNKEKVANLQERCTELENLVKSSDVTIFSHEENLRIMKYEIERKEASIKTKDENLATAETLLKELTESKKEAKKVALRLKKDLDNVNSTFGEYKRAYNEENFQEIIENRTKKLREDFEEYKRCFNEEIMENKVNEVETKMRGQAEGMKKLAEELLKIEANARKVEAEKAQLEADCR